SIYPNPASIAFTIEGTGTAEKVHYSLYNILGLELKAGEIETNGGFFTEKIQVSNFSNGMYFIKLNDKNYTWTKKLNLE
ncbi:MAG: T9SS type A sorting domain-containing protein, partial [Flavobacterium sp.]